MTPEELMRKIGGAKPLSTYGDRIAEGETVALLKEYAIRQTEARGTIVAADFVVVESERHAPGSLIGTAWFVSDGGWQGERELSRAQAFVKALLNVTAEQTSQASVSLLSPSQPGKGIAVRIRGTRKGDKGFVEANFSHVQQTPEDIARGRAAVEAKYPDQPAAVAPPPPPPPPPPPTPGPTGGLLAGLFPGLGK